MNKKTSEYNLLSGLFFRLLPYQILLLIITAINGIIDTLYASNMIGESAMSAIGLFGPLNHFLYAASITFVSGSQVLYGRYLATDRRKINHLFTVTLVVSGALSLLTSILLVTGVHTGATKALINIEPDLQMLNRYILGQAIGIPALILGQQLFSFMSLENRRKWTMTASIICFVVNAVCDQLFIVLLPWGTFGLGLATSVSEWLFFFVLAAYYIMGKSEWKFSIKKCDWQDATKIVTLGYSGALSRFVEMFRCLIVNFLIIKYVGSVGVSSFAASNSVLALIWPVPFGMVAVARMLFSISVGEEDRRSLVDEMKIIMTRGMLLLLTFVAALIIFAEPLTRMFYRDPSDPIYHYTVMGFRLMPLCMPLALWSLCYVPYVQAVEKKIVSVVLPIVDGMVGVVVCSFFLIPTLKMNGLYIANILNGVICAGVIFVASWIVLKHVPHNIIDMMAIPKRIGVSPEDRIDISVAGEKEVLDVSIQIYDFCIKHDIDKQRTLFSSLCMEEMAGNIVRHGFSGDSKKHSVDIRVVLKDDDIILRIRDNCIAFNPSEYHKIMQENDDFKNIGIKLVYGIAKKVDYQNLLGMNVLTIRI
ncbi:MAG: ATP-binding protein [Lachnospiraceae bacterium]|nr:ATP-binding protein [Lachnospiraceae bacterium]